MFPYVSLWVRIVLGSASMKAEFQPAIEALQKTLAEQERQVIETKTMINKLCELAGAAMPYPDTGEVSQIHVGSIQGDTFYGKSVNTAAREYLEMRRAAKLGPATPRDVFEALKKGGFVFNSKNETNSITVIRTALSKQSSIFHRLPTGEYGLTKWYDKPRKLKFIPASDEQENQSADSEVESADE